MGEIAAADGPGDIFAGRRCLRVLRRRWDPFAAREASVVRGREEEVRGGGEIGRGVREGGAEVGWLGGVEAGSPPQSGGRDAPGPRARRPIPLQRLGVGGSGAWKGGRAGGEIGRGVERGGSRGVGGWGPNAARTWGGTEGDGIGGPRPRPLLDLPGRFGQDRQTAQILPCHSSVALMAFSAQIAPPARFAGCAVAFEVPQAGEVVRWVGRAVGIPPPQSGGLRAAPKRQDRSSGAILGDFEGSEITPVERSPREGHESYARVAGGTAVGRWLGRGVVSGLRGRGSWGAGEWNCRGPGHGVQSRSAALEASVAGGRTGDDGWGAQAPARACATPPTTLRVVPPPLAGRERRLAGVRCATRASRFPLHPSPQGRGDRPQAGGWGCTRAGGAP